MIASTPENIEGKVFDRYSISLAVNAKYKSDGSMDASAAMRLLPTRIAQEGVETADQNAKAFVLGSLDMAQQDELLAFSKIKDAVEEYLKAKGL